MYRHPFGILITLLILVILAGAGFIQAQGPTYHWQVNANGSEGSLDLSTESGAQISGTLLGSPVEGWLVGRHLVLIRQGSAGPETWEAWLATPENVQGDDKPILAGTFLRSGGGGLLPWFGTSQYQLSATEAPAPVPATAVVATTAAVTPKEQQPDNAPEATVQSEPNPDPSTTAKVQGQQSVQQEIPPVPAPVPVPHLPSGKPSLAGTWDTPDGPLTIRQEGSSLVFVLPDREISGRLTGSDSLIGGFGPGCCKGHLEQGFAVIGWDNGVSWFRK